jgi:hypothetical protein
MVNPTVDALLVVSRTQAREALAKEALVVHRSVPRGDCTTWIRAGDTSATTMAQLPVCRGPVLATVVVRCRMLEGIDEDKALRP